MSLSAGTKCALFGQPSATATRSQAGAQAQPTQRRAPLKVNLLQRCVGALIVVALVVELTPTTTFVASPVIFGQAKEYYYTRTRNDPQHLRVSEEFKNRYVNEVKLESRVNGTRYEYYKSSLTMSHDELVFETIDKMFQHRLSAFYIHHYDNYHDKQRSFDPKLVNNEACARDLMYLVDKLPKRHSTREPYTNQDEDHLTPELTAFFDSYAKQEPGLLMGNTYWVGAYDQCVNRHIFELTGPQASGHFRAAAAAAAAAATSWGRATTPDTKPGTQAVSFKGRYCVSALKSRTWDSIIENRKLRARHYFKSQRQIDQYPKLFRLQVGICLPSSCDSTSIERHAEEVKLLTTSMLEQRYSDYELVDLYCLPDEASPLRQWSASALAFLALVGVWMLAVVGATCADMLELRGPATTGDATKQARAYQSRLDVFVTGFSLRANYLKLMAVSAEQGSHAAAEQPQGECSAPAKTREPIILAADAAGSPQYGVEARAAVVRQRRKSSTSSTSSKTSTVTATTASLSTTTTTTTVTTTSADDKQVSLPHLRVNLRFLNAFKALIMFWIVNGHIMLLMIQTAKNILYSDALLNGLMHFLIGATFGVDLFFTMTGFITAYLIFNSGHAYKMRPATWLYLAFHRYWRLAPMYLLTFWFSRSVAQMLGSGPLWDYGTAAVTFRGLCNYESWLFPLTLTSNLHGLFDECMITSWYISCDMQFFLVSPIFVHLLAKRPSYGWSAALATVAWSSKLRYDAILTEASARHDELVQPRADIFMRVSHDLPALYTHPHHRISAYLVGLLAGHFVYMVKSNKWSSSLASGSEREAASADLATTAGAAQSAKSQKIKTHQQQQQQQELSTQHGSGKTRNIVAMVGLFLFVVMAFVSYLLANFYPSSMLKHARMVAAIAFSVDHLIMSVGASLVIITMCLGQWSNLVNFLSKPFWTRMSKLNYALLLLQCEAIYFQIFQYDQVPMAGTRELINILFNLLVTLYPAAFVATLVFEFPLANMEKLLRLKQK